jgi:hypothetical protein
MIGATVVSISGTGCRYSNHNLGYLGIVESVKGNELVVRIVKKNNRDWRDVDFGIVKERMDLGTFQQLAPNLYLIFR